MTAQVGVRAGPCGCVENGVFDCHASYNHTTRSYRVNNNRGALDVFNGAALHVSLPDLFWTAAFLLS